MSLLQTSGDGVRTPTGPHPALSHLLGDRAARAIRRARSSHVAALGQAPAKECTGCLLPGLPPDFRFHDLRHYFASLLIASGADVKVVQARLRHASAENTLDTYGHLWPDSEERTTAAIDAALAARTRSVQGGTANNHERPPTATSADPRADSLRTVGRPRP